MMNTMSLKLEAEDERLDGRTGTVELRAGLSLRTYTCIYPHPHTPRFASVTLCALLGSLFAHFFAVSLFTFGIGYETRVFL